MITPERIAVARRAAFCGLFMMLSGAAQAGSESQTGDSLLGAQANRLNDSTVQDTPSNGSASGQFRSDLEGDDTAVIDSVVPAYLASVICNFSLRTEVIATALAARMPVERKFGPRSLAEVLGRLLAIGVETEKNTSETDPDYKEYCAQALSSFGPQGSEIKGALDSAK